MRTRRTLFSLALYSFFCLVSTMGSSIATAVTQEGHVDLDALDANNNPIPGCKLRSKTYYDPANKPATGYHLMVAIHGGGWTEGKPWEKNADDNYPFAIHYFTQSGYYVVAPSYRLLAPLNKYENPRGCGNPTVAEQKRDIKNAFVRTLFLASLNTEIARNEKTVIYGESAGGHLAVDFAAKISPELKPFLGGVVAVGAPLHFWDILGNAKSATPPYGNTNRSMTLAGMNIPVPADNTNIYKPVPFGGQILSYYWNGGRATSTFVDANPFEAIILENTLSQYINSSSVPMYLVVGNNDAIVAPEQSLQICNAFGTPAATNNTTSYKRARCGTSSSYMEVIINGGHIPTDKKSELHPRLLSWMKLRR